MNQLSGFLFGQLQPQYFVMPIAFAIFGYPILKAVLDDRPTRTIALATMKHEPWWMLSSYIPTFFIGTLI